MGPPCEAFTMSRRPRRAPPPETSNGFPRLYGGRSLNSCSKNQPTKRWIDRLEVRNLKALQTLSMACLALHGMCCHSRNGKQFSRRREHVIAPAERSLGPCLSVACPGMGCGRIPLHSRALRPHERRWPKCSFLLLPEWFARHEQRADPTPCADMSAKPCIGPIASSYEGNIGRTDPDRLTRGMPMNIGQRGERKRSKT